MAEMLDLKKLGEIEKRVSKLRENDRSLLKAALVFGTSPESIRLVEQIAGRYTEMTATGREYVDKTLGIERS